MTPHARSPGGEAAPETAGMTIGSARLYEAGRALLFGLDRRLWNMVVELADIREGHRVLDVGCGTGALALVLAGAVGRSGEVCGIDASPPMIQVARRKASRAGAAVEFRVALIEELPYADGRFDRVVNTLVMHHLPEEVKRKGLAEIHRVLKPGGSFLAVDLQLPKTMFAGVVGHAVLGHHMAHSDIGDSLGPLRGAGFQEVSTGPTSYSWFSFVRGVKGGPPRA